MPNWVRDQLIGVFLGCWASDVFGNTILLYLGIKWYWLIPFFIILTSIVRFVWKKWLRHFFIQIIIKTLSHSKVKPYAVRLHVFLGNNL